MTPEPKKNQKGVRELKSDYALIKVFLVAATAYYVFLYVGQNAEVPTPHLSSGSTASSPAWNAAVQNSQKSNSEKAVPDNKAATDWLIAAIPEIFSFKPGNQVSLTPAKRQYFTDKGAQDFNQAMLRSRILEMINANNQTMSATIVGPAKVFQSHAVPARPRILLDPAVPAYSFWDIEIPVDMSYESPQEKRVSRVNVNARITTMNRENNGGFGLESLVAVPR